MDNLVQGSPEWSRIRLGKVTASRVADIVAKTKSGYSTSRANYAAQLIVERLTGTAQESFSSPAMQWGVDMEPEARAAYEYNRAANVELVGFVPHPIIADTGASPDGLVGTDGLIEIKAPLSATHIDTLLRRVVPGKYITQMQWQLACTGRQWCDFVSYDPRMPESMRFFCTRIDRDDAMIADLEREVIAFLNEVRETVIKLKRSYDPSSLDPASELLMAG
jgi:putative phage-type endonuclease